MKELSTKEIWSLRTAEGLAKAGRFTSAFGELEKIAGAKRSHPLVLQVVTEIFFFAKRWYALMDQSKNLIRAEPDDDRGWINCSYALHRLTRTREALDMLLPVADKFARSWCVPYNLACYTCQLGDKTAAIKWLKRAIEVAVDKGDLRKMALNDPDLESMWVDIAEI